MRVFVTRIIVLLVAASAWLGGLAVPAKAAEGSGVCQMVQNWAADCQGPSCEAQAPCEGPDCAFGVPSAPCAPRWDFAAEAIVLERTATRSQPLFINPQRSDVDPLNAMDLNFPVTLGFRVSGIRHDVCGCDWEVGYFQADGFAIDTSVPGPSTMIADSTGQTFSVNDGHAYYKSAIYSGEVNARWQLADWFTMLAGYRMGQVNERYLSTGTTSTTSVTDYFVGANTSNQLYGLQLGADIGVYDMGGPLQINVLCKAGAFDNFAHQNYQQMIMTGGVITRNIAPVAGRNQAAFLGETGAVATYALTKRLAFRASLEVLWLTGLALAPEQITGFNFRTGRDTINTSGGTFYYGGGAGLEYKF